MKQKVYPWIVGLVLWLCGGIAIGQTERSLVVSDGGNVISRSPIDWRMAESHYQLFYPNSVLNLPADAEITSISFSYYSRGDDLSGGDIQIRLGEIEMTSSTGMSAPLDNSEWQLCYKGGHQLTSHNAYEDVSYLFSSAYKLTGGGKTLVVDITNEGSPRTTPNSSSQTYFEYSSGVAGVWSWDDYNSRVSNGVPDMTITYRYGGTEAILQLPYQGRVLYVSAVPVGSRKTVTVPVANAGNSSLFISEYLTENVSLSSVEIAAQTAGELPLTVKSNSEGSFVDYILINSNGGTASLQVFGTTYQLPKASNVVYLDGSRPLSAIVTDNTIQELSIVGAITVEDWQYLASQFSNLSYLDLSEAIWFSDTFPSYSFSTYAFESSLQRLTLPMNVKDVYCYQQHSLFANTTNLRQLVLPVSLERVSLDLSQCVSLNSIVSLALAPPYISREKFPYVQTVYVPAGAISAYKQSYSFSQKQIQEIDQDVLNGQNKKITQLDIKGSRSSYSSRLIDYGETETHSRLFIPSSLINLPLGSAIDAFSFDFRVDNYNSVSCDPGSMKIAVAFANSKEEAKNLTSFESFYEGSDQIDVSKTDQVQTVAYSSTTPLIYNGSGIVVDIISARTSVVEDYSVWVSNPINECEDYRYWRYDSYGASEWDSKPDVSIHFSTISSNPILNISADDHSLLVGYAPVNGTSIVKQIPVQNIGASDLTITGMSGNAVFSMDPSSVTIPAYSTGIVGFTFHPTEEGTVKEKVHLLSNGGEATITLMGSTLRKTPYWHDVTVSSNYSLADYFDRNRILRDTITALSVTGSLSNSDWWEITDRFPNLKYLDLSTATIPNDFYSSSFAYPENIVQLALPLNYGNWAHVDQFVNLQYLMYPMTTEQVYMDEFDNCPYLNSLVVLASTPPEVRNDYKENGITKVYVPAPVVEDYKLSGGWFWNAGTGREILPITPEVLGGEMEVGSSTIVIQNHRTYDTSNYPTSKRSIWISPKEISSNSYYDPDDVPTASLCVAADTPLEVETLGLTYPLATRRFEDRDGSSYASFINHSTQMRVDQLQLHLKMRNYYYWYFLTVPFSMPLSNLQAKESNASYVIRTYAGDLRAVNGANGYNENWRDLTADDCLKPGKGYIFQSNDLIDSLLFTAPDPMVYINNSVYDQTVSVEHFDSANESDKNWNLIGNPYFAFYDIHQMKYSAPIIIRDDYNYVALSPIDDDYALRPLEAFFVQVPDEVEEITFPHSGQQTTPYITTTKAALRASLNRQVFNLRLTQNGKKDRSRVVLNPEAKGDYEVQCDAAKWMSESDTVPQLYTLDNIGTKYAINERPVGNGIVPLGVRAAADGEMTLSLTGDPGSLRLYDKELKREVDLAEGDYTFLARKGTIENRFELRFSSATTNESVTAESIRVYANGSQLVVEAPEQMAVTVYSTAGVLLHQTTMTATRWSCPLSAGIYVVRVGDTNHKVIIY